MFSLNLFFVCVCYISYSFVSSSGLLTPVHMQGILRCPKTCLQLNIMKNRRWPTGKLMMYHFLNFHVENLKCL